MPSPLASDTKTRLSRDAPTCSCLTLWTPTVGLYGGRINTRFSDDPSQYGPRMLLQVRAHARAFAKFANVLPISMQNKCYSRSICMPVWFSRGHGRDIKGHGMLFYM